MTDPDPLDGPPAGTPADIDLFTSGVLFGQPGIYPGGSPMVPAPGGAPSTDRARRALVDVGAGAAAIERFEDEALVRTVPDAGVRAGLCCLAGTVAAPVLDAFPTGTAASSLRYGATASPGRVVGPPAEGEGGADPTSGVRVVNDRYRAEHPALLAGSLAHDLLWTPELAVHAAEATLHAIVAVVHIQLIARWPELARLGTELCRRQSSLAITLLNSRHAGSADISLVALDGVGTIPGGDPAMQTPDFWSVPFAPIGAAPGPPLLREVLAALVGDATAVPDPLVLDEQFGTWLSDRFGPPALPVGVVATARAALTLPG